MGCSEVSTLPVMGQVGLMVDAGADGAAAGAWAAVMVELWCLLALPEHILVGHVLPLVALAAAGAALSARK